MSARQATRKRKDWKQRECASRQPPPSYIEMLAASGPSIASAQEAGDGQRSKSRSSSLSSALPDEGEDEDDPSQKRHDMREAAWERRLSSQRKKIANTKAIPSTGMRGSQSLAAKSRTLRTHVERSAGGSKAMQDEHGDGSSSSSSSSSSEDDPPDDTDFTPTSLSQKKKKLVREHNPSCTSKKSSTTRKKRHVDRRTLQGKTSSDWLDELGSSGLSRAPKLFMSQEEEDAFARQQQSMAEALESFSQSASAPTAGHESSMVSAKELSSCPFCHGELPEKPSAALTKMLQDWLDCGRQEKRRVDMTETTEVCLLHRQERDTIPAGIAKGWPKSLNIPALQKRLNHDDIKSVVLSRLQNPASSDWFRQEKETREKYGRQVDSVFGQWGTFGEKQAGYYGEQGREAIECHLEKMLLREPQRGGPQREFDLFALASRKDSPIKPLDYRQFLDRVIFPEVVCAIIRSDHNGRNGGRGISIAEARRIRDESSEYGVAAFPLKASKIVDEENLFQTSTSPFKAATQEEIDAAIGSDSDPETVGEHTSSSRGFPRNQKSDEKLITTSSKPSKERVTLHNKAHKSASQLAFLKSGKTRSTPDLSSSHSNSQNTSVLSPLRPRPRPSAGRLKTASHASSSPVPQTSSDDSVQFLSKSAPVSQGDAGLFSSSPPLQTRVPSSLQLPSSEASISQASTDSSFTGRTENDGSTSNDPDATLTSNMTGSHSRSAATAGA